MQSNEKAFHHSSRETHLTLPHLIPHGWLSLFIKNSMKKNEACSFFDDITGLTWVKIHFYKTQNIFSERVSKEDSPTLCPIGLYRTLRGPNTKGFVFIPVESKIFLTF